jgi:uncharacterized protein YbcI
MDQTKPSMAQQVAQAASEFHLQRTGLAPAATNVVLSGDTLVVILRGALSPAEMALAKSPGGAGQVQEYHRELFASASQLIVAEIKRITGVEVRETASQIAVAAGTTTTSTSGTMVLVFLLARGIPLETWNRIARSASKPGMPYL